MYTALTDTVTESLHPLLEQNWQRFEEKLNAVEGISPELLTELTRVSVGSDFVSEQLSRSPVLLQDLLTSGDLHRSYEPDYYESALTERLSTVETENDLHRELRLFRNREQVRIIWRDLTRRADMRETTRDLSLMADACIDGALNWLYGSACERWGIPYGIGESGEKEQQRLVVMGMGKLGGGELNFSSDIDVIYLYEHDQGGAGDLSMHQFHVKLFERTTSALGAITEHGMVMTEIAPEFSFEDVQAVTSARLICSPSLKTMTV